MDSMPCPQVACAKATLGLFVEEGLPDGESRLYPIAGARWCPEHGITELVRRPGGVGPVRIGRLVRAELRREYPPRGQRVWRPAVAGEGWEIRAEGTPEPVGRVRVAGLRWDAVTGRIVPLENLGRDYFVLPGPVDRDNFSTLRLDVEEELRRHDEMLRESPR